MCLAPPLTELNDYTVIMDAAPGPDTSDNDFSLMLVDDPVATGIREEFRRVNLGVTGPIIIIKVSVCVMVLQYLHLIILG